MRSDAAFPSRFIKALDVPKPRRVIIDQLSPEKLNGEEKHVLSFQNEQKLLVLNRTNWEAIEDLFGDSDDWPGQTIELYADRTTYQGKRVPCVRVRGVSKPATTRSAAKSAQSENPADDFDDPAPVDL